MSKRRLAILTAWAVLAAGAGCDAPPPPQAQGHDVVRPAQGYAINVPKGWTWRDLGGDCALEIFEPAAAGEAAVQTPGLPRPRAVVHVVVVDREGLSLDAWADQAVREAQDLQADLEVVRRQATRLTDGREALEIVLRSPRGLAPLVQRLVLAMTPGRAYALIVSGGEADLAAAESAVRTCTESFIVW